MGVSGIRHGNDKSTDVELVQQRKDLFERHVTIVRALIVPPADVQTDVAGVDAFEGIVDGGDDPSSPIEELLERSIAKERVSLEGEIGRIDLEQ
jgi:hypothetical protein